MVVEDKMDSDHHPVVVWVRAGGSGRGRIRKDEEGEKIEKIRWTEEGSLQLEEVMGKKGNRRKKGRRGVGRDEKTGREDI